MPQANDRAYVIERLVQACRDGRWESAMEIVISKKGIINIDETSDDNGVTALHWAADRGSCEMIECSSMLEGASVDPENDWNSTPLFGRATMLMITLLSSLLKKELASKG